MNGWINEENIMFSKFIMGGMIVKQTQTYLRLPSDDDMIKGYESAVLMYVHWDEGSQNCLCKG